MLTKKQLIALQYVIAAAPDGNKFAKQLHFFLLAQSAGLTKEVCITLQEGDEWPKAELRKEAHGIDSMWSSTASTHLPEIMAAMGTRFIYSLHYGHYGENGEFDTKGQLAECKAPLRYTFWLAHECYADAATKLTATRKELEAIDVCPHKLMQQLYATKRQEREMAKAAAR